MGLELEPVVELMTMLDGVSETMGLELELELELLEASDEVLGS